MTTRRWWIGSLAALTLAYYFWTAMITPGGPPRIHGEESDHFNLLSRGFKKGHLYLDGAVPEGLLKAANPYDPALRSTVSVLHDASYFQGKYYIYFGPAPVVTVLLPFSLLTGRDLPLPYAVWFFSSCGYLALVTIFLLLQRRYFPRASLWTITAGLIALGGASLVVALLRRAHIWELSGASGFGFFSVSLLCLVHAVHSSRPRTWATLGGLALGLAVASRPTYILCSVLFLLPWVFGSKAEELKHRYDWRAVLGAAAGCTVFVVALLVYNYARFGNPLEFGLRYQLTSVIESESRHFSLSYVPFNIRVYFFSVLQWLPRFPFANGIVVPPFPPGLGGHEYTFGLFPNLPFSCFSLLTLAGLAGWRKGFDLPRPFWLSVGAVAVAAAINIALLLFFFGSCLRYMVDFTPCVMLLAAIGVVASEERLRPTAARWLLRAGALGLAAVSTFTAAAGVVYFYESIPGVLMRPYHPVARVLNAPYYWLQQRQWPYFGPQEVVLTFPVDRTRRQEPFAAVERHGQQSAVLFIDYLDDHKVRFGYRENGLKRSPLFSPAVAAPPGARHTFRFSIGGPYSDYNGLQARLRAQFDRVAFWDVPAVTFGAYPGKLRIGTEAAPTTTASRFTGEIHSIQPIAMPDLARPPMSGIRVRVSLKPEMVGLAFPLLTTGRTKAGDVIYLRVRERTISFGYDHWGDAGLSSPEIPSVIGESRVIEIWAPALLAPGRDFLLLVKVDGVTVWEQKAHSYAVTPETIFLGSNPIGASTCEVTLENAVFEELQLPAPKR